MGLIHNYHRQVIGNAATISWWKYFKKMKKGFKKRWHDGRVNVDRFIGQKAREIEFRDMPVENDKIMFMTFNDVYQCNPKYITEEILRRKLPYKLVWAVPRGEQIQGLVPKGVKAVGRGSYEFYQELSTAHVWVDNALNCLWMPTPKSEGQVYINTWHGSMGLKRIGPSNVTDPYWLKAAERVSKAVDYLISNSAFETVVYHTTYFPETPIFEYGHPRNDMLCIPNPKREAELRRDLALEFGFNPNDKLLLYAPTFRDDGSMDYYDVDFDGLITALERRFGGTWRVLSRMHFHNRTKTLVTRYNKKKRIVDVTSYPDMQELMAVADAGLTDYSSWCCDYMLTGKPCFLYVPDYEQYKQGRGLYYDLEETPFPIAQTNWQLCKEVANFNADAYRIKLDAFLSALGSKEDGHAAERVVDLITQIIEEGKADAQSLEPKMKPAEKLEVVEEGAES